MTKYHVVVLTSTFNKTKYISMYYQETRESLKDSKAITHTIYKLLSISG